MKVTGIKTHKITQKDKDIFRILDRYVKKLSEKSVVAIASKIVAITEGRIIKIGTIDKDELIKRESQYYLPRSQNPYNVSLTITGGALVASAGIDESNGNGFYILWPKNPQKSANRIRIWLKSRFNLKNVGVIITDSRITPLRWGVTGFCIAYSGFEPLKNYIGKKDIFVLAVIGFFFALGIEWRAILFDRWSYTEAMPIIPYFQVGLAPIIQMSILLPLSFYITELFNKNSKNHSK